MKLMEQKRERLIETLRAIGDVACMFREGDSRPTEAYQIIWDYLAGLIPAQNLEQAVVLAESSARSAPAEWSQRAAWAVVYAARAAQGLADGPSNWIDSECLFAERDISLAKQT